MVIIPCLLAEYKKLFEKLLKETNAEVIQAVLIKLYNVLVQCFMNELRANGYIYEFAGKGKFKVRIIHETVRTRRVYWPNGTLINLPVWRIRSVSPVDENETKGGTCQTIFPDFLIPYLTATVPTAVEYAKGVTRKERESVPPHQCHESLERALKKGWKEHILEIGNVLSPVAQPARILEVCMDKFHLQFMQTRKAVENNIAHVLFPCNIFKQCHIWK